MKDLGSDQAAVALIAERVLKNPISAEVLTDSLMICSLLNACIVDGTYIVPDALTAAVRLTKIGERTVDAVLNKNRRAKRSDATLAVFLEFSSSEGLLVSADTDVAGIRRALSEEVLTRRMRFPFIFGRELHDAAADLFPAKTSLDMAETNSLLRRLPVGVFQAGVTIVGPFGVLKSSEWRNLLATRHVPGYRCSDETCSRVHSITLATGKSRVSKLREVVHNHLEATTRKGADFYSPLMSEALARREDRYNHESPGALIDALADDFSIEELRTILGLVLRDALRVPGFQSHLSKMLGTVVRSPIETADSFNLAQVLQCMLLFPTRDLVRAIENAIDHGDIALASYEIRTSRLRRERSPARPKQAEIGILGARFVPSSPASRGDKVSMMHRLLSSLYIESDELEQADLQYILGVKASVIDSELLGTATEILKPEELVRQVLLHSRASRSLTAQFLNIELTEATSRDRLVNVVLWKLGITAGPQFEDLVSIERICSNLISGLQTEDQARGDIANLFALVEEVLFTSLSFTAWALTQDHVTSDLQRYTFDPATSSKSLSFIEQQSPTTNASLLLSADGRSTLVPLAAGFSRFSKALASLAEQDHIRPGHQKPMDCRISGRPFAFSHTIPFLDLTDKSQALIIEELSRSASLINQDFVIAVRNASVHGNNLFPSADNIDRAVESIRSWVRLLRATGFYPTVYDLESESIDSVGRRTLTYTNSSSIIRFLRPSWAMFGALPTDGDRLVMIPAATFDSREPLRFRLSKRPGGNEYWDGWPKRWGTRQPYDAGAGSSADEDSSAFASVQH